MVFEGVSKRPPSLASELLLDLSAERDDFFSGSRLRSLYLRMKSQLGGTKSHLKMDDLDHTLISNAIPNTGALRHATMIMSLKSMNMVEITHPEATVASIELGVSQEVYEVYLDAIASP